MDRLRRMMKMLGLLQSGDGHSLEDLSCRLKVSTRTILRDINMLKEAGLEFVYDREANRYVPRHTGLLQALHLTPTEALALMMLVRKFLHTRVLPDYEPAASAGMKIESLLPRSLQDHCGPLLEQVEVRHPPASDAEPIAKSMAVLQRAVASRRRVRAEYQSYAPRETLSTVLDVYRIAYINRGWYAIAHSRAHRNVRSFRIERFTRIEVLDERYRIDRSFSLDKYFGNAWCMVRDGDRRRVRVEFSPLVAGNVEEIIWHRTQRITRRTDGSILFEVDVDGLGEIAWWILGFGDQARVLAPAELRRAIARRAAAMHQMYVGENGHGHPGGRRGGAGAGQDRAIGAAWHSEV